MHLFIPLVYWLVLGISTVVVLILMPYGTQDQPRYIRFVLLPLLVLLILIGYRSFLIPH